MTALENTTWKRIPRCKKRSSLVSECSGGDEMIPERVLVRLTQIPGVRSLWHRFPVGSVDLRVRYGIFSRPHYAYGVYSAASLAKRLKLRGISAIEFGVAGGRGLQALESIARI